MLERLAHDIKFKLNNKRKIAFNAYISYPGQSGPFATDICNRLVGGKIKPWIATLNCPFGSDWRRSQVEAMTSARVHIIVISKEFLRSNNDVLRTEVLVSGVSLALQIFGVEEPELKDRQVHSDVYSFLRDGDEAFRRIAKFNWYRDDDLHKLKLDILAEIRKRGNNTVSVGASNSENSTLSGKSKKWSHSINQAPNTAPLSRQQNQGD